MEEYGDISKISYNNDDDVKENNVDGVSLPTNIYETVVYVRSVYLCKPNLCVSE